MMPPIGTDVLCGSGQPTRPTAPPRPPPTARRCPSSRSTPRAWGRLSSSPISLRHGRSTPTRVGTTPELGAELGQRTVHPHARGDDGVPTRSSATSAGPPPRAWGRRLSSFNGAAQSRSTPTRVGTTCSAPTGRAARSVHPHARGDDGAQANVTAATGGPPPRAWGRRLHRSARPRWGRSTPTRVGTTSSAPRRPRSWPVHPHARGDDVSVGAWALGRTGPPPRAWGRQRRKEVSGFDCRSTPTRVGTTKTRGTETTSRTVHPHARGDDAYTNPGYVFEHGPPPRAWGRPTPTTVSSPP